MLLRRHSSSLSPYAKTMYPSFRFHTQANPTNSTIKELVQSGQFTETLHLYASLWNHGFKPDNFTFPYILKASSHLQDPTMGLLIHTNAIKTGFDSNLFVGNSLILFYGRFSYLFTMQQLFEDMPQRNIVTYTGIISAFTQNNLFPHAIQVFHSMRISGLKPNSFTMATILPSFSYRESTVQVHGLLIKCGLELDTFVSTALVDTYAKCGDMSSAYAHFSEIPLKNLVSWNAILSGYTQNGNPCKSLDLFRKMQGSHGKEPDSFSIVAVLCSCSMLTSVKQGKEVHGYVYRSSSDREVFVGNGLIDMYGKCGDVELAQRVFDKMKERNVCSWTTLINCYGLQGYGEKAISIFENMKQMQSINPNHVTVTAVLSACSHSCLLQEGFRYFETMSKDFGITPTMKHYACMVDMLGRAGLLIEALKFTSLMPIQPGPQVWEALLGASSIRGDAEIAEIAVRKLLQLEPENPELYVQLSNIYARAGKWEDVASVRGRMRFKRPGQCWVQINVR